MGRDAERDAEGLSAEIIEGTIILGAEELAPKLWWDAGEELRRREPVARLGNVFIFRGTFQRPKATIARRYWLRAAYEKLFVPEPAVDEAIALMIQSAELDPTAFYVSLELGNQYLKLGQREKALAAYEKSLEYSPRSDGITDLLREQVERLRAGSADVTPIRNPGVE